jgi:hypothetical protein
MKTTLLPGTILTVLLLIVSCNAPDKPAASNLPADPSVALVATEIMYDVEIKNPDKEDAWTENALKGLKREELVDHIFDGLYNDQLEAYDIFEGTRIRAGKIRKMEENGEFTRDQIGKMQFTEHWIYDPVSHNMTKKVTAISLGTENFDSEGFLIGYYPLFKVVLP